MKTLCQPNIFLVFQCTFEAFVREIFGKRGEGVSILKHHHGGCCRLWAPNNNNNNNKLTQLQLCVVNTTEENNQYIRDRFTLECTVAAAAAAADKINTSTRDHNCR